MDMVLSQINEVEESLDSHDNIRFHAADKDAKKDLLNFLCFHTSPLGKQGDPVLEVL